MTTEAKRLKRDDLSEEQVAVLKQCTRYSALSRLMRSVLLGADFVGLGATFLQHLLLDVARRALSSDGSVSWDFSPQSLRPSLLSAPASDALAPLARPYSDEQASIQCLGEHGAALLGGLDFLAAELLMLLPPASLVGRRELDAAVRADASMSLVWDEAALRRAGDWCGVEDEYVWWKEPALVSAWISCWMSGAGPQSDTVLAGVSMRFLGLGGEEDDSDYYVSANKTLLIAVGPHELTIRYNDGCADANTGFFGRVYSREGVWALFHGSGAGDCGTLVEATDLGLARWVPLPGKLTVPEGAVWSENAWNHQLEALCMAWMHLAARASETAVPPAIARSLRGSVMRVIGRSVDPRVPPAIWTIIGELAHFEVPPYVPKVVEAWKEGNRDPAHLRSLVTSPYMNVPRVTDYAAVDSVWPESTYGSLGSYEDEVTTHQEASNASFEEARNMLYMDDASLLYSDM